MQDAAVAYRRENGVSLIDINLDSLDQLFNSLDPAPFRQKDLDTDAEDYIVGAIEDFPLHAQLKLVFHLPAPEVATAASEDIPHALHHYFGYSLESSRRRLRGELREGRATLAIGLGFLFLCMALRQIVLAWDTGTLGHILAEGLLISGWVAMWRPLDAFLYGWWPIRRKCAVYRKLTTIAVDVRPSTAS